MPKLEFPGNPPKRIVIDASHTLKSGLNTGVQRVVRSLCEHLPTVSATQTRTVVHRGAGFYAIDFRQAMQARGKLNRIRANVLEHLPKPYLRGAQSLCNAIPTRTLKSWLLPQPGHQGICKPPLKIYERWIARNETQSPVCLGAGDLLILPDAYWAYHRIWPAVAQAKRNGAWIATVVYDLIPLQYPDFVAKGSQQSFAEYLYAAATHSDLLVTISETIKSQVAETLLQMWPTATLCGQIDSFELGASFAKNGGHIRKFVEDLCTGSRPYLMVASFDPRKNQSYALNAFEMVWKSDPTSKLLLVGRIGQQCEADIHRIRNHPRYGRQLFAFHDLNDSELNLCYEHAKAVIFPSIVEGFGLPIVEAMWRDCHVFASDIPIHREVGKQYCSYCDLNSPQDLADQILAWEQAGSSNPGPSSVKLRPKTWEESSRLLLDQCLRHFSSAKSALGGRSVSPWTAPTDVSSEAHVSMKQTG